MFAGVRVPSPGERRLGRLLLVASALTIGALTLVPLPYAASASAHTSITCLACGEFGGVDVLLNVLLFVPFGLGLALVGLRPRAALLTAAAVTLGIESTQYFFIAGRDASLSDVLTNIAGAACGIAIARDWRALVRPTHRGARRLAGVAAAAWILVLALGAYAMGTAIPRVPWWAQWAPSYRPFNHFTGRVLDVRLDRTPLPADSLREPNARRRELLAGRSVSAAIITGWPTPGLAPIVRLVGGFPRREILLLGQRRNDLVLRVGMRAARLRLRIPAIRLPGYLAGAVGDSVQIAGSFRGQRLRLWARRAGQSTAWEVATSPSWGWSLLLPMQYAIGPEVRVITVIWLAAFALPIGFWARAAADERPASAVVLVALALATGLAAVPWLSGYAPAHWSEWCGACAGALLGWLVGARMRRDSLDVARTPA